MHARPAHLWRFRFRLLSAARASMDTPGPASAPLALVPASGAPWLGRSSSPSLSLEEGRKYSAARCSLASAPCLVVRILSL